jgi:hypothetical protein
VLALLTSAEYRHLSPKQLVPRLADDGRYLPSESTMYRVRRRVGLSARRPLVLRADVTRATTVHQAVRSNQVWSWDITYLPTVTHGRFLRLYTSEPGDGRRDAGRTRFEPGYPSPQWYSILSLQRRGSMRRPDQRDNYLDAHAAMVGLHSPKWRRALT